MQISFQENIIDNNPVNNPKHVYSADLDGDGDMDVLSASFNDDKIAWYENTDGLGNFGFQQIITSNANGAQSVYATDIDGDGDIDVLTSSQSDNTIAWFENTDGDGVFGEKQVITDTAESAKAVFAIDVDGDGDNDVLSASFQDNKVAWYENIAILNNEIFGTEKFDVNSNGCEDDMIYPRVLVETSDGTTTLATFTNTTNGNYKLFPLEGDFSTQILDLPNYYTSTPLSQLSQFSGLGESEIIEFCVTPFQTINDLSVSVYPTIDDPRPGFDTKYQIVYSNFGTTQLSGNLTFQYDGSKIQFLGASETPSSQSTGLINFNYANLNPFETRTIELNFNVFPPPTTNIDEILTSTATINPTSLDETQEDNTFTLEQLVIGSYDPNDIRVLEGEEVFIADIGNYLHYIIRFQNTGTASAINVRVEHILDDNLDWNTMKLQSLSHEGRVEISNGNDIQFIFDDINLPDSTTDEPNSHGFITFKIKPKSNLLVGDEINAIADIYFDFNPPIITNTTTTEFVVNLGSDDFSLNEITVYPNPTDGLLKINSTSVIQNVEVFDMLGRKLLSQDIIQNSAEFDLSNLQDELYFVRVETDKGIYIKKVNKD